ncbi:MAG: chorismate synthase [Bacillota bacterium]
MNHFGQLFSITLYGESHQKNIGVVIEGVPPGITIDETLIKEDLAKRNPELIGTTPRKEKDDFTITSGIFNQKSTGSAIHITIENKDIKSKDYANLVNHPRPGHSDFVANNKYFGYNDYRGGGQFSGRLTAPLVIAGSIAKMIVPFTFQHSFKQIGTLKDMTKLDNYLKTIESSGDSVGGIVHLEVKDIPIGLGEPLFNKIESSISQMLFSIPAVKGVQFGTGFEGVNLKGSEFNDVIKNKEGQTNTNHAGGVSGGITNGNPLLLDVFIKPTSSIKKPQKTYNFDQQKMTELVIEGRHDVAIVRRAPIVLENAVAIVLTDFYLRYLSQQTYEKIDNKKQSG